MSNLLDHARAELKRAGLFDKDADYNGKLGKAVLSLIRCFAGQNHSGASAKLALDVFDRLVRFEPLTPLTSDPAEWMDVSEPCGRPLWQSTRWPAVFSEDGGKTWSEPPPRRGGRQ
jgi:hypothetical protein